MRSERCTNLLRRIRPLDARIKSFGVLPENDDIDERFLEATCDTLANEIQWIARKRDARAYAGVELEALAHRDDRAEVGIALAPECRAQFGFGLLFRF